MAREQGDRRLRLRPNPVRGRASITTTPICAIAACASGPAAMSRLALKNIAQAQVRWLTEPDWYESSPIAKRPYCAGVRHVARLPVQGRTQHGPDRRRVRRSGALQARHRISARRACTRHGSTPRRCRASAPTNIRRWSIDGSRRPARCREGTVDQRLDRVGRRRVGLARSRAGASGGAGPRAVLRRARNWIKFGHAAKHRRAPVSA